MTSDPVRPPPPPAPPPPEPRPEPAPVAAKPEDTSSGETSPGARLHDGFYLRLALGANYGRSFVQTNRVSRPDLRIVGMGSALDFWAGTTLPAGVVVGLSLSLSSVSSDAAEVGESKSASGSSYAFQLGGFLDTYPNPREGYHFGGSVALTGVRADADADGQALDPYAGGGLGVAVFAGYDAWIGSELSLGGLVRLGGAVTRDTSDDRGVDVTKQGTVYGAQVLVTLVYH